MMSNLNRYEKIIEHIFISKYKIGMRTVSFVREDIEQAVCRSWD